MKLNLSLPQIIMLVKRVILVFCLLFGANHCQPVEDKFIGDPSGFVSVAFRGMIALFSASREPKCQTRVPVFLKLL